MVNYHNEFHPPFDSALTSSSSSNLNIGIAHNPSSNSTNPFLKHEINADEQAFESLNKAKRSASEYSYKQWIRKARFEMGKFYSFLGTRKQNFPSLIHNWMNNWLYLNRVNSISFPEPTIALEYLLGFIKPFGSFLSIGCVVHFSLHLFTFPPPNRRCNHLTIFHLFWCFNQHLFLLKRSHWYLHCTNTCTMLAGQPDIILVQLV